MIMNCVTLDDSYQEYRKLYNFYCQINELGRKTCNPPYMSPGDCESYVYDLYEFEANLSDSENWENYDKIINDNTTKMRPLLEALGVQIIQTDSTTDRFSNIIEF